MKFGAMNCPSRDIVEEVKTIGELGFDYVDFTVEGPRALPDELEARTGEVRDILSSYSLDVVGHTAWFLQLAHPYDSIRRAYLEEALKALEVLAKLGAYKVTYHPFLMVSSSYRRQPYRAKLLELMASSFKVLSRRASELGAVVMAENLDGGRMWSLEEYKFIVDEGEVYFHLDVGHANLDSERLRVEDFLKAFPPGSKLMHVHVSDNFGGSAAKGWDLHLPLGAGRINWAKVFKLLRNYGYDDTVTLEVFSKDRDYLRLSLEKARRLSG